MREVAGGSEHRTAVYTSVHEDSSTEPTHKFPTGVEFGKKSIIKIVAAENSYAQVAQFLGGDYVRVHSMMPKLNIDPHLFTADATQAKALAQADIVIFNGAHYDTWVPQLLMGTTKANRQIIEVAQLVPWSITNPHLWYDPRIMPLYAQALTQTLKYYAPTHAVYFDQRLAEFTAEYQKFLDYLLELRVKHQGVVIVMTEPLFEPMAAYLQLKILGKRFAS